MTAQLAAPRSGSSAKSAPRMRAPGSLGAWPLLVALAALFLWPAAAILASSVTEPPGAGLSNVRYVLSDPTFARFFLNTVRTAFLVSAITGAVGYFYAHAIYRARSVWRIVLMNCAIIPFWTSLLVRSFAWTVILRDTGIINWSLLRLGVIDHPIEMLRTPFAVTVGMAQILLPFVILPTYASMAKFDPGLLRASRSLGAGPFASFWLVFFPSTRVGLTAGLMLVFVLSLGYYITPVLLGGPGDQPIAVLINAQVGTQLNWGLAGAMSAIVAAAVLVLLAAGWRTIGKLFLA